MAYNPSVNDRSGDILAGALNETTNRLADASQRRKRIETMLGAAAPDEKGNLGKYSLSELEGMLDSLAEQRVQRKMKMEEAAGRRSQAHLEIAQNEQNRRFAQQDIEREAIKAAYSGPASTDNIADSIARGFSFEDLDQLAGEPSVKRYLDAGGADPAFLEQLAEADAVGSDAFRPEIVLTNNPLDGSQVPVLQNSPRSAIPLPDYAINTPGQRGGSKLDLGDRVRMEGQVDSMWNVDSAASPGRNLRQYYAKTRDANGLLKPGAETNQADEAKINRIQLLMDELDQQFGGQPSRRPRGEPKNYQAGRARDTRGTPMTPEEFVAGFK